MKKLLLRRKIHRLIRSSVCLLVIIAAALCYPLQLAFADDALQVGMKWTRIKSQTMMNKYFGPTNDKALNSVNEWTRCLIISPDGKFYVRGCNSDGSEARSGENLTLTQVTGPSGIKSGKDEFTTRSDLGATSLKYICFDGEHAGNKYYIRCNGARNSDSTTGFDGYCIGINMSWYGVKWHAAARAEYRRAPVGNPGAASDRAKWACSATISTEWTIAFGRTLNVDGVNISEKQMRSLRVAYYFYDGGSHGMNFWEWGLYISKSYPDYLSYAATWLGDYADKSILTKGLKDEAYELITGKDKNDRNNYRIREQYFKDVIVPACTAYEAGNEDVRNDCAMITFNTEHGGVHDRTWNYSSGQVEFCKSEGNSGRISFMIYYGTPCAISILIVNTVIAPYTYGNLQDYTIKNNVQVNVGKGATLSIEGTCYNNGRIVVDGGTLIIKGCLDSDPGQSDGEFSSDGVTEKYRPGDILVKNGGTIIIEKGASLLHRNNGAELRIEGSSYMRVKGLICVANALAVREHSQVRVDKDSLVLVGVQPNITKGADDYNMEYLQTIKGNYMSSLVGNAAFVQGSLFNTLRTGGYTGLIVTDCSSYMNYGGTYIRSGLQIAADSYFDSKVSTNIEATIASMVRDW